MNAQIFFEEFIRLVNLLGLSFDELEIVDKKNKKLCNFSVKGNQLILEFGKKRSKE